MQIKLYKNNSYQERWRDWPFEARQPNNTCIVLVLNPAMCMVCTLEDKRTDRKLSLLLIFEGGVFLWRK